MKQSIFCCKNNIQTEYKQPNSSFFICSQHLRNDAYVFLHNRLAQAVAMAATVKLLLSHFCTRILSLPRSPVFIMLSIMLRLPNISAKIKKLLPTTARHMIATLIFSIIYDTILKSRVFMRIDSPNNLKFSK